MRSGGDLGESLYGGGRGDTGGGWEVAAAGTGGGCTQANKFEQVHIVITCQPPWTDR